MGFMKKGTGVTCPNCHRGMVKLKVDPPPVGTKISASQFEAILDNPREHKKAVCPFDGTAYVREKFGFHTEKYGWTW